MIAVMDYGEHIPLDMDNTITNADGTRENKYSMMQFASLYFRRAKNVLNGDSLTAQRKKKDSNLKDLNEKIRFTERPISHSLLKLDSNEADKQAQEAFIYTALICLQNLAKTFKYGGRKFLLSGREVEAITMGKSMKQQLYHLPGGHKTVVNTKAVTVVEEIIQQLCIELNIRSAAEQQEFCLCYILESESTMKLLSNDEYILDVCTELEHQKKDYFLLLKRTVWIHPLRLDNSLYIDVMFFQVLPDYIEGFLIAPNTNALSAVCLDDVARLGAYLHLSDSNVAAQNTVVLPQNVHMLLPQSIVGTRPAEQWTERINRKLMEMNTMMSPIEARAAFLEVLERWPLFGSTFFYIQSLVDSEMNLMIGECLIAINKFGLRFLTLQTHETVAEYNLAQVLSTNNYETEDGSMYLDIKVGTTINQRTITLNTDKGAEISRLLGQYIYVDSENLGFINGGEIDLVP
ncbi:unnamed protein product [Anisakis simplex]|uniref:FERM domain-containing protein n=1 Tax=Anisakis simplex TaxID=6269 RepID=A0A0M3K0U7_ANISI|nr:unnamed protein product [Anisakis simplex]